MVCCINAKQSSGVKRVSEASYVRRVIDDELDALLPSLPAISLDGAKGVGKTSTALQRASTRFDLDDRDTAALVEADPARLTDSAPPVLIDEWQRFPDSWDLIRRAVDRDRSAGRFILTGSMAPTTRPTHSGAGRIVGLKMRPMSLAERHPTATVSLRSILTGARLPIEGHSSSRLADYADEIVTGGFPGIRFDDERAQRAALDGYLDRIVERDFPDVGLEIRNPAALTRWLTAYAAATSSNASYEKIRDAATGGQQQRPAKTTTIAYRDALEALRIVEPLPGWTPTRNQLKRVTSSPKHHLVDPALTARLLGVGSDALLAGDSSRIGVGRDGPLLGTLFESLVTLGVRVYAQAAEARVHHLRTFRGDHEVDLIVERSDQRVVALEVKIGANVGDGDVRHLLWLRDQIGDDLLDAAVITTGRDAYRRTDGIAVIPAALLGP